MMNRIGKKDTTWLLHQGLQELARHRPDKALVILREAVDSIPPACNDELSKALYWLSVALLRLDKRDLAIKSLSSAQKLRRRGFARRLYLRTINEYGMPRQPSPELDDFYAFMNIQMSAYLVKKPMKRFSSYAERETVLKILMDTWKQITAQGLLLDSECGEKLMIFQKIKPSFPEFGFSSPHRRSAVVAFTSAAANSINPSQRCPCGSGLPYSQCCGRVRSVTEL
ncbi:MAG: SEC-C domain-containing protein [Spirochaetia bacterium]|nr:SEC-C domain-containing protein [Spirochaetia bacterium]